MAKKSLTSGRGGPMKIDGIPVKDAKEPLILEVNASDIKHSNRQDPAGCAAAVAAMRQEGVTHAYVYRSKVYILREKSSRNRYYERYENPRALRIEVGAFDKGGEFEPNEFKLNAPYPSQSYAYRLQVPGGKKALPTKSTYGKYGKSKVTGTRRRQHVSTNVRARPAGYTK